MAYSSIISQEQQREKWRLFLPFHWVEIITHKKTPPLIPLFLLFMIFPTIILSTQFVVSAWPNTQKIVPFIREFINKSYPDDLVIDVENGEVHINQTEPYFIDFPHNLSDSKNTPHLITFDSNATATDFDDYNTIALISKNLVYYTNSKSNDLELSEKGKIVRQKERSLTNVTVHEIDHEINAQITKSLITTSAEKILTAYPWATYAKIGTIIIAIFFFWLSIIGTFFIIFFNSLIVYGVGKMTGIHFKFERAFVYTCACSAILIMTYRICDIFVPHYWSVLLLQLRHLLIIGFAYLGFRYLLQKRKTFYSAPEAAFTIGVLPVYLAQDLIASKRSTSKKFVYLLFLIFFIFLPWVKFYTTLATLIL